MSLPPPDAEEDNLFKVMQIDSVFQDFYEKTPLNKKRGAFLSGPAEEAPKKEDKKKKQIIIHPDFSFESPSIHQKDLKY